MFRDDATLYSFSENFFFYSTMSSKIPSVFFPPVRGSYFYGFVTLSLFFLEGCPKRLLERHRVFQFLVLGVNRGGHPLLSLYVPILCVSTTITLSYTFNGFFISHNVVADFQFFILEGAVVVECASVPGTFTDNGKI